MPANDEYTLISLIREGNEAAFAKMYHQFAGELLDYAVKVLKDEAAAEDILQELFANIWKSRERLQVHTSLRAYLYAANKYLILKTIRDRQKEEQLFSRLEERIWGPADPENLLYRKELKERIALLTADLPGKCREIYLLSREQFLPNKVIAAQLNISEKTVENQLTIALRKLRAGMGYLLAALPPIL
ncbi:RNA polymerase sigma-70 factor (ECF subfamily) [Chitinophaga skermanii]|uniref:RNA polymerase sigma-70 factor (ECF subfamily) n=1 Tax=Chitinophaga skermanii TaxID=331697 RepID=A0A327QS04_9BACT|nr:RNA polymerase sigma-70 factor [Chitinophaga skermanii]RAJ06472.1 RNA polymerase sigma-70 factor (ECF subfamily) [Chitinophaga skermanii]